MRIALAQTTSVPVDVLANLAAAERTIAAAAERGAALTAFPELSLTGYELDGIATTPAAWLTPGDARLDGVRRACSATRTAAILGAPWRDAEGRPRLAAIIVGPDGEVHASPKQYLHGREHDLFVGGRAAPPFSVAGWRVAVAVCFDVAHPAHAAEAAAHRADLYVGSALYMAGEERRCDLHFGARAMDNRVFTALANHAGTTGGHVSTSAASRGGGGLPAPPVGTPFRSIGGSGAWDPTGKVVQRAGLEETLLVIELDRAELERFRT